jgi:hypothetical protein
LPVRDGEYAEMGKSGSVDEVDVFIGTSQARKVWRLLVKYFRGRRNIIGQVYARKRIFRPEGGGVACLVVRFVFVAAAPPDEEFFCNK